MLTQTDLVSPAEHVTDAATPLVVRHVEEPIAVPCGFRDRHNNPCQRLGNWPIMDGAKQMLYRDRPMVHCDPACSKGDPPGPGHCAIGDELIWGEEEANDGDV